MLDEVRTGLEYVIRTSGVPVRCIRVDGSRYGRRYVDARVKGRTLVLTRKSLDVMLVEELAVLAGLKLAVYRQIGGNWPSRGYAVLVAAHFVPYLLRGTAWFLPAVCLLLIPDVLAILHGVKIYRRLVQCKPSEGAWNANVDPKVAQSAVLKMMEYGPNREDPRIRQVRTELIELLGRSGLQEQEQ